jgi:hypothetical protein
MDPTLAAVLGVLSRWLHVSAVIVLLGGVFYARTAYTAGGSPALAPSFRPAIWFSLAALIASGLYNFLTKASFPPHYHMWFGIKMLLALHVIAALLLLSGAGGGDAKRLRSMTGILVSGALVVAVSAWLRWISLHAPVP